MNNRTCSIDGCDRPTKSRGWCQAHYFRWRRNGDPGGPQLQRRGYEPCHIGGCDRDVRSFGLCDLHEQRYRKWGDPYYVAERTESGDRHPLWTGDGVGYSGAHDRVRNKRGSASGYQCEHCGAVARQWAYDHADPNEKVSDLGPYSPNIWHYMPLCVPCHKRFDLGRLGRLVG